MTAEVAPRLSVVLLCFNEEDNVLPAIEEARGVCAGFVGDAFEILVIDDGSTDVTAARALEAARDEPRVRVVSHPRNRGYGEAMLTGLQAARGEWLLLTDGDRQFHLADLERLWPLGADHDLVQGWRDGRDDPPGRILLGHAYRRAMQTLFSLPVRDPECAFRLLRREVAQSVACRSRGDLVPVELLWRAHRAGWRLAEVGVRHRRRQAGVSHALSVRNTLQLARELLAVGLGAVRSDASSSSTKVSSG